MGESTWAEIIDDVRMKGRPDSGPPLVNSENDTHQRVGTILTDIVGLCRRNTSGIRRTAGGKK